MILTHQHIDHLGLVSLVAARSGAEVAAIDAVVPLVENFPREAQAEDDFAREGCCARDPRGRGGGLQSVSQAFRAWGARATVTRPLSDGAALALGDRTLNLHHRPGHSPTDTVFHAASGAA